MRHKLAQVLDDERICGASRRHIRSRLKSCENPSSELFPQVTSASFEPFRYVVWHGCVFSWQQPHLKSSFQSVDRAAGMLCRSGAWELLCLMQGKVESWSQQSNGKLTWRLCRSCNGPLSATATERHPDECCSRPPPAGQLLQEAWTGLDQGGSGGV